MVELPAGKPRAPQLGAVRRGAHQVAPHDAMRRLSCQTTVTDAPCTERENGASTVESAVTLTQRVRAVGPLHACRAFLVLLFPLVGRTRTKCDRLAPQPLAGRKADSTVVKGAG